MIWLTWALVGKVLTAWLLSALAWLTVALVRERPANYHDFCAMFGLCMLWFLTVPLEILLTIAARRDAADRRSQRQASP